MTKFLATTVSALALAGAVLSGAPAHAQLLGGHLGGGLGGGLPLGSFGGVGSIGADSEMRSVRGSAHGTEAVRAPKKPAAAPIPAVNGTQQLTGAATLPRGAAPTVTGTAAGTGSVAGAGKLVGSGTVTGTVASTGNVTAVTKGALNTRVVDTRVVAIPTVKPGTVFVPALGVRTVAVPSVAVIPAIPDLEVRRTAIYDAGIAPITYAEVPTYIDQQYSALQNDLRGTGVEVIKRNNQIVLEMPSDVTFAFNKYDIQPRFYGVLREVAQTLAKYPATYVDVDGHTDAIGSYAYNQVLSEKRAGTVAEFLAARQVNPARMHVEGFGKTEPIASNATISGRAANRRVEIVLTPYAA